MPFAWLPLPVPAPEPPSLTMTSLHPRPRSPWSLKPRPHEGRPRRPQARRRCPTRHVIAFTQGRRSVRVHRAFVMHTLLPKVTDTLRRLKHQQDASDYPRTFNQAMRTAHAASQPTRTLPNQSKN